MKEVDRLAVVRGRLRDQRVGRGRIERELRLEKIVQLAPLGVSELAVERRDMDEQRRGSAPVIVLGELVLRLFVRRSARRRNV